MTRTPGSTGLLAVADSIAAQAHAGQVDKLGVDYIDHPRSVAGRVNQDDEVAVAAALLHDVVEDSGISASDLRARGIPEPVIETVELLTRSMDVPDAEYFAAIRQHPTALTVKLADLADNTEPTRLAQLPDQLQRKLVAKYENAYRALGRDDLADALVAR